jgi:hypothetical protein
MSSTDGHARQTRHPDAAERRQADASTSADAITKIQTQINSLAKTIAALGGSETNAALAALLTMPNGLVVLKDGVLITRVLTAGTNIAINYPDGHDGNPVISSGAAIIAAGGGRVIIVTEQAYPAQMQPRVFRKWPP